MITMKFFFALVLASITVVVTAVDQTLPESYMAERYTQTQLRHMRHPRYPRYPKYDYDGVSCNRYKTECGWYTYTPSFSWGWSHYCRRGFFWYPSGQCLVYCMCEQTPTTATPTTTVAAATTTAAAPTTTAATTTTSTTAAPTTTTTAAPTTTTATTSTTAAPTTTTTTTAAPTTTATTRFCPVGATTSAGTRTRLLGGTPIGNCSEFPGLVSIASGNTSYCTGVITGSTTLTIPSSCAPVANGKSVIGQDGQTVVSSLSVTSTGVNGGSVEVTLDTAVDTNSCPGIACVYSDSMASDIDLNNCQMAATGYDSNSVATTSSFSYADIPSLQPTDDCAGLIGSTSQASAFFDFTNTAITYNCFINPSASTCQGDFGGMIQCPIPSTGEKVVIGQIAAFECVAGETVGFYNLEASSVRISAPKVGRVTLG